ncbi:uncharacterized protein LOC111366858 [Olea europaea var. sylvestris]|uniref:uncharacterized protein LOC111366858 n=1 Tax=Olea europaea var. sylvestris TaxID=158386 RepID=UPI000C1D6429|nr:uncharacterized protein LOC111366858 [Olea europaea var. sylvestris]
MEDAEAGRLQLGALLTAVGLAGREVEERIDCLARAGLVYKYETPLRVIPWNTIVHQRGTRFHPLNYVGIGKNHTLHALKEDCIKFESHKLSGLKWVRVEPEDGHEIHPTYASEVMMQVLR